MSGMCIRLDVINDYKILFDENLSFYGIDTKFSIDYSKKFPFLYVLDYRLKHNLSKFEKEEYTIKERRFKSHCKASLYIAKKISIFAFISCLVGIIRHRISKDYLN